MAPLQIVLPSKESQFPSETAGEGNLPLLISSLDGDQFFRVETHGHAASVFQRGRATKTPLRIIWNWLRLILSLVMLNLFQHLSGKHVASWGPETSSG